MERRYPLLAGALVLLLLVIIPLSAALGAASIPPAEVVTTILSPLFPGTFGADPVSSLILFKIRLPRIFLAGIAGAGLALGGAAFQGVFRNPLAEPYLLGISSGAALGATLAIVLGPAVLPGAAWTAGLGLPGVFAFIGALLTMALIYLLAGRHRFKGLLLGGIALGYVFQAAISLMMMLNRESLDRIVFWMMGSFTSATWAKVTAAGLLILMPAAYLFFQGKTLNILSLGSREAHSLGVNPHRTGGLILLAACLITAAVVSVAGIIGFVGLMVPHILRLITGPDHRRLLPVSALGGAILLIGADMLARTVLVPREIPVGVITAVLGGPFFLYLLARQSRGGEG